MQTYEVREEGEFVPANVRATSPEAAAMAYCAIAYDDDPSWPGDEVATLTIGDDQFEVWIAVPPQGPQWGVKKMDT